MPIFNLNCRFSRPRLDAYIDGELSPKMRRRVGQHLDRCSTCYALYVQQRDLKRDLQRAIPLVGQKDAPDFQKLWGAIRSEIPNPPSPRANFQARYGFVALILVFTMALPFTMAHRDIPPILPSPPAPQTVLLRQTPDLTEPVAAATAVASLTVESEFTPATSLPIVAEPPTQDFTRGTNGSNN